MRNFMVMCIVAATCALVMSANAATKATKGTKTQDIGAIRNKCRAEVYGYGTSAAAQFRACVQRAQGR